MILAAKARITAANNAVKITISYFYFTFIFCLNDHTKYTSFFLIAFYFYFVLFLFLHLRLFFAFDFSYQPKALNRSQVSSYSF